MGIQVGEDTMKTLNAVGQAWERQQENQRSRMEEEREDIIDGIYDIAKGPWMDRQEWMATNKGRKS